MAIVKILKSSKSFAAVSYNDKRVKRGEAELVKTANFSEVATLIGFDEYLKLWGDKNKRIKNKQFHVTISLEGKEKTKDELVQLGEQWLKEMGYGENPYMIYFHNNTEHPHIHIVTSRLDKNGCKIDNNFENERAVRILRQLECNPELSQYRKTISDLLRYSFTTKYQFMELCARNGFSVHKGKDSVVCRKGGERIKISNQLIEFCSERYRKQIGVKDKKKMQSLIYKYAAKLPKEKFSDFMKQKFGLEFVFYGKQNDINGYTIIDYPNRSVYKGSEIFGAKKISELFDLPKTISDFDFLVQDILDDNPLCDYEEFKSIMRNSYFYEVEGNQVKDTVSDEIFELKEDILQKLQYHHEVKMWAECFKPYNDDLARVIANLVRVRPSDMRKMTQYEKPSSDVLKHFNDMLREGLNSNMLLKDFLDLNHVCLVVTNDKYFVVDYISHVSISSDDLDVKFDDVRNKLKEQDISDERTIYEDIDDSSNILEILESTLSALDFSGLFFTGSVGGAKNNKRRKKRIS